MTNKFHSHKYWKHRGDCCDFMGVIEVIEDDGVTALLRVSWNTQLDKSWKTVVCLSQLRISKGDYPKYHAFNPRGERFIGE